jgi:small basic protein
VATSLEQIKVIGNALTQEVIQAIESIFWHLKGCMHHLVSTEEGRHQFLFYIVAAASLVFVTSTLKEGISLTCLFLLRVFTAPRLVREYGNLRMRPRWFAPNDNEEIVLPHEIKDRINVIVRVSAAASARGFPMRSILIHGKPGCGKSVVAKRLAESTGLPYAMMSGGDSEYYELSF